MPAVRAAAEGRLDEALPRLKSADTFLTLGIIAFLIGALNTAINILLSAFQPAVFTAVLGFVVGLTLITISRVMIGRAKKVLDALETDNASALQDAKRPAVLSTGPTLSDTSKVEPPAPGSVTENTTLKLKRD